MVRGLGKKMSNEEHLRKNLTGKNLTGKDRERNWSLCYLFSNITL